MKNLGLVISISFAIYFLGFTAHAVETNCSSTGATHTFPRQYVDSTRMWCPAEANIDSLTIPLLRSISNKKAQFFDGSVGLMDLSGFTAITLAGYKANIGMLHSNKEGTTFISLHFTNGPKPSSYWVTYKIDPSELPFNLEALGEK